MQMLLLRSHSHLVWLGCRGSYLVHRLNVGTQSQGMRHRQFIYGLFAHVKTGLSTSALLLHEQEFLQQSQPRVC
jgi:hypothetical protein